MIKAIIFDIGGVLVPNLDELIRKKINNKIFNKNFKRYCKGLDSGKITLDELNENLKKYYPMIDIKKVYLDTITKSNVNKNMKNLALKLKNKYKVVYLSNTFKEPYLIRKKQKLYKSFNFCINSYKVKLRKPSPEIYKLLLKRLKLNSRDCLFIDDRKDNILTAKKIKMNYILFKNYKDLLKNLKKYNLNFNNWNFINIIFVSNSIVRCKPES